MDNLVREIRQLGRDAQFCGDAQRRIALTRAIKLVAEFAEERDENWVGCGHCGAAFPTQQLLSRHHVREHVR